MKKQAITIYDVAREAGVSMATVSRVVNGNPNVKPSTRKKVSEVIERLNYRPNAVARGLASKKTTTVGVILPSIMDLFFSGLARGIDDIASMYKYNIILTNTDNDWEKELQMFNTLLAKQVDGIIFLGYGASPGLLREVDISTTPVVFAGTDISQPEKYYSVTIDYREATQSAVSQLLERNKRVALLVGTEEDQVNKNRILGYQDAHQAMSRPLDESLIFTNEVDFTRAPQLAQALLDLEAEAVVTQEDIMAASILNEIQDLGVEVPASFEIITSHNTLLTDLSRPKLSAIEFPVYDVGAVAMRLLTKIMSDEEIEEKNVVLPHNFKQRGSTR